MLTSYPDTENHVSRYFKIPRYGTWQNMPAMTMPLERCCFAVETGSGPQAEHAALTATKV
jgi:hypothetical protein